MTEQLSGGHFLISRLIFHSAIWGKHPLFLRLWIWLLGKAVFQDGYVFKGHTLKRGELVTTYGEISDALSYCFNRAIIKPTIKEIRIMLSWLQSEGMILMKPLIDGSYANKGRPSDLTRAYIGLLISIVKYDTYQDLESYKGRDKGRPSNELGQLRERMKRKNDKRTPAEIFSEISSLEKRYSDQETINQAFQAISSTRKSNRVTDSVKLSILKSWERYPIELVISGIQTYISKNYADQGKDEKYLLGIIRNSKPEDSAAGMVAQSMGNAGLTTFICPRCDKRIIVKSDLTPSGCVYCEMTSEART